MARETHHRPPPSCPNCGATVYRTHRCTARPRHLELVPMPEDFRTQLDRELHGWQERRARAAEPQPEQGELWPARAQLDLVEPDELTPGADPWGEAWREDVGL